MKILIMEDEKLLKPPLPEALVILDVTAPGINSRQVAEEVETCIHFPSAQTGGRDGGAFLWKHFPGAFHRNAALRYEACAAVGKGI